MTGGGIEVTDSVMMVAAGDVLERGIIGAVRWCVVWWGGFNSDAIRINVCGIVDCTLIV